MQLNRPLTTAMLVMATSLTLGGCSAQKSEDVRFKLCKEVTTRLMDSMKPVTFKSQSSEIRSAGDAAIRLNFTINRKGHENKLVNSACYFEYQIVEQTVIDHVDPLAAYSTLPYKMTIQGKEVPQDILNQAVSAEQIEPFVEFAEQVRREIEKLPERIK